MNMPNNVVLVRVRVSKPSASKVDRLLTSELATKHSADEGMLRASKSLFDLREANRYASRIRQWLRENAVPWSAVTTTATGEKKADAMWAIRGHQIKEFTDENRECREGYESVRDHMVGRFDDILIENQKGLGTAFRAEDYPSKEEFEAQWAWEMTLEPLTDTEALKDDFRLAGVPEDVIEEQVAQYKNSIGEKVAGVARNVVERVQGEILGKGSKDKGLLSGLERFDPDEEDGRKGNTFRDVRLYRNMDELREFATELADVFKDNEEIADMRDRLAEFCDDVRPEDPELVRTDTNVRQRVIDGLKGLLDPDAVGTADDPSDDDDDIPTRKDGGFANVL